MCDVLKDCNCELTEHALRCPVAVVKVPTFAPFISRPITRKPPKFALEVKVTIKLYRIECKLDHSIPYNVIHYYNNYKNFNYYYMDIGIYI